MYSSEFEKKQRAVEYYRQGLKCFENALKIKMTDSPSEKREEMKMYAVLLLFDFVASGKRFAAMLAAVSIV